MRNEVRLEEQRMRMKAAAGILDFFGVIFCALIIIALIALLANLVTWLIGDLTASFSDLQKSVTEALIVK